MTLESITDKAVAGLLLASATTDRNLIAEARYRNAWDAWRATWDDTERQALEATMDALQPYIATSPVDPRWEAFRATLDSYREYWEAIPSIALANLKDDQRSKMTESNEWPDGWGQT